jgi:hypothetical protein
MPTKDANDGTGASGNKTATTQQNSSEQAGTIRLDFGRLEVGRVYGPNLLKTVNSGVFLKPGPYTVTAIVTESEDPSVALTALGDKTSSTSSK